MNELPPDRYASDWNRYSQTWDRFYGARYQHLGDEWCDDGTSERHWERRLFGFAVEPYLAPSLHALEIGPGGGKWTVRLAPRVQHLTVFDVADAMLARTRERVESEGLGNVSFVHGGCADLGAIADQSVDLVFSYDVFVHIALEDTVAYVAEISRVLRNGGVAIIHHAVNDLPPAWDRIESHNAWYRNRVNTLGQYYYQSRGALEALYDRFGLRIESAWTAYCTTLLTARRPSDSVVPRLERALGRAGSAEDEGELLSAAEEILAGGRELSDRLEDLVRLLHVSKPGAARFELVQRIRRLVRG
jgi:ubiquinone/menaquinone biosynthesis C-methylase UbiE